MAAFMQLGPRRKVYQPRRDQASPSYHAEFRFMEENVTWMAEHFLFENSETRGGALSNKQRMEVFLRYIGDPGFQVGVGKDMGIHQCTVSRTFANVLEQVVEKASIWIQFPTDPDDIQKAKDSWLEKCNFPCAIGALDCTHILIQKPGHHGDEYVCRKGVPTLNVQATCDAGERFTSVSAEWPGSVHDSRIWKNSPVGRFMSNSRSDALLLGDEGYGIAPWLMTPFKDPATPEQRSYNKVHKKERVIIERCFGQVKRRFPILQGRVRVQLEKIPKVILACFILHNVSKYLQDPEDFPEFRDWVNEDDDDDENEDNQNRIRRRGQDRQREIAAILHDLQD
ncbi:putative nuclease HARBI1 [Lingula anatina]|uniref:Putative nuclease HARBI1 n=1 Tax=Lingula anatina TaxID=7574 RepID=A0A1S3K7P0_LINAN|nr:putative nuclease HARBI1 [Lingula anatina]|eukprot:XP_013418512.1 putative nuclease HARBI1 [Lingula anatina]